MHRQTFKPLENLQLIITTASSWSAKQGKLSLYERLDKESKWRVVQSNIPVVFGENGLAWGIGLHPPISSEPFCKQERDQKAPAGIFSLGTFFGFTPASQMKPFKMPYLLLHDHIEAVDDPLSRYYNSIVDNRENQTDWKSSEKMGKEPLYELGLVINHNFPNPKPNAGSAIFFHIWKSESTGTAGCTAMKHEDLERILYWLDEAKNPLLIQLPIDVYHLMKEEWSLPDYSATT